MTKKVVSFLSILSFVVLLAGCNLQKTPAGEEGKTSGDNLVNVNSGNIASDEDNGNNVDVKNMEKEINTAIEDELKKANEDEKETEKNIEEETK